MTLRRAACLSALALVLLGFGPCAVIRGTRLNGPEATGAVSDWSFVNDANRCAVEVRPDRPYSVTVNCMSWQEQLYVSCSRCEGKTWSALALEDSRARIRIGERVYPVTIERVTEPAELDAVWRARAKKLGGDPGSTRAEGWWTFHLRSRR